MRLTPAPDPQLDDRPANRRPPASAPRRPTSTRDPGLALSDLIGGRVLAWIGGAATLVGIALFLALAISRGWIGVEARLLLAGTGSTALMAAGSWLHAKRGRTEASIVLVGVATAGLFATLLVASHVYGVISGQLALAGAVLTGGVATVLAVRWAGRAIAALGVVGALVSPVLVGAPLDGATIGILAVSAACAGWITVKQGWNWLGLSAVLICAPQWGWFVLDHPSPAVVLAIPAWFGVVGLAAALGQQHRDEGDRVTRSAAALLTLNGVIVALVGAVAVQRALPNHGAQLWLVGVAAVHAGLGLIRVPRLALPGMLQRLSLVLGIVLADGALALISTPIVLVVGWGAAALVFAAVSRRGPDRASDRALLDLGIGAHIALAVIRALLAAPPSSLSNETPELLQLLCMAMLAASCLTCGHVLTDRTSALRPVLNGVGLAAVAYLTAQALTGPALVVAWAIEAVVLTKLAARNNDPLALLGAGAFVGLAGLHVLLVEAPPSSMVAGAPSLLRAAESLAIIVAAFLWAGYVYRNERGVFLAAAGVIALYLISVVIVTAFQPSGGVDASLLDLSIRQQGQVLLSACWCVLGVAALVVALRKDLVGLRNASLALLLLAVAKVFLYDLSTLTSLYRVVSFIAVGLLSLGAAFAYQRLRPPPPPDMRSVHPSQR